MNKKILGIVFSIAILAMLVAPVLAKPTNGPNKVAVTVTLSNMQIIGAPEFNPTGNVNHVYFPCQRYQVSIKIEPDGPTLLGTVDIERKLVAVKQPNKGYDPPAGDMKWIFTDYLVFKFDGDDPETGFVGNGKVIIDGATQGTAAPWEKARANGLFQGTGDFEGQTLNVGRHWSEPTGYGTIEWYGYWLKYEAPTL